MAWLLFSASAFAQGTVPVILPVLFPVQLKQYLGLSDDQVARMYNVRTQVYGLQAPKFQRQAELQLEIAQETAKTAPNPTVLGTRYAEIEFIRRDLDALQKSLAGQTQAILGADQKTKLAKLQEALSLYSIACSAVGENLLTPPVVAITGEFSSQPPSILDRYPGTCTGAANPYSLVLGPLQP